MNVSSERSQSIWMATAPKFDASRLNKNETADVVVIGSGIAGLSTAYELAASGLDVIVVDRGPIGRGMTARTSGHLTWATDDDFTRLIAIHGKEKARQWYDSHLIAIARIEEIQEREAISCGFARIDGYEFSTDKNDRSMKSELKAARSLGIEAIEEVDSAPVPGIETGPALRYANQARFHALLYLNGLAAALKTRGARLYAETTVTDVSETKRGVTVTTTGGHTISAKDCVVATNGPIIATNVHEKQKPYRTYVIALAIPYGAVEDALLWDTLDPYHYVRLFAQPNGGHDLLIVGGEDHAAAEAGDMFDRLDRLETWTRKLYPEAGEIEYRWSGQVLEPTDCVAYMGRRPRSKHTYMITGDSGEGLTHGVAGSLLIHNLIVKGDSPWEQLYSPSRRPTKAPAKFHRDRSKTAVKPSAEPPKITDVEDLEPGDGAILKQRGEAIAAYRDTSGRLHEMSAKCTHLGCTVQWNAFEGCWDCPCHGSQFAADGTALNGPAIKPLEKAQAKSRSTVKEQILTKSQ